MRGARLSQALSLARDWIAPGEALAQWTHFVTSICNARCAHCFYPINAGKNELTLDEIENKLRESRDARIHFAIVCASKSCPPLAPRAYRTADLNEALERQGREFVNDGKKNIIDRGRSRVALSKIFYWNRKEFERDGTLLKFVSRYVLDPKTASWLAAYSEPPEFLSYDWSPNQP